MSLRRRVAEDRAVVVGSEERLDACVFRGARKREPLLPTYAFLAFDHQGESHDAACLRDSVVDESPHSATARDGLAVDRDALRRSQEGYDPSHLFGLDDPAE